MEKLMSKSEIPWYLCPLDWWGAAIDPDGEAFFYQNQPTVLEPHKNDWTFEGGFLLIEDGYSTEDWQNSAMPIPEREAELNRLAETKWQHRDMDTEYRFFWNQIKERRKQRIEAGLIDVNDTDVVEMKDNLTWLAKNVSEWPENAKQAQGMLKSKNIYWRGSYFLTLDESTYSKDQWLQRRLELGLESEQSKSTEPEAMAIKQQADSWRAVCRLLDEVIGINWRNYEGNGKESALHAIKQIASNSKPQEQEWKDGLPPVGTVCEGYIDGMLVSDSVLIMGYFDDLVWMTWQNWDDDGLYYGSHKTKPVSDIEFIPIQSTAERKRKEFVSELLSLDFSMDGCSLTDIANGMYDWLIDNDMLKDGE